MSDEDSLPEALPRYVRGLLAAEAYPHRPADVELIQTHISYVFLAGDLVYKTKKAVDLGFVEQTAPGTRERLCHAEVRLNRRLAPDVYMGVVPVVEFDDGHVEVEPIDAQSATQPGARVVEWAVKMRRLPEDRTLDRVLESGGAPDGLAERIVAKLVEFHAAAQRVTDDREFAGAPAERRWWEREYAQAAPLIGETWRAADAAVLRAFVEERLEDNAALFDARLAVGRIVEGHGDLQAKHVYVLGNGAEDLVIVDCVEFNDWYHFRYLDAGYDVAFLAMDLEARGHAGLGDEIAGRYIAATADETMGLLQPLHRTFRAFVRGKVESIGAQEAEVSGAQRAEMAASAVRYFELASTYAKRQAAPCLVVLAGLSGSGKTVVGATLAARAGAALVSSDPVRNDIAGREAGGPRMWQQYEDGLYAPEVTRRTYEEMRRRARAHLEAGRPVVLDATHRRSEDRRAALAIAREVGVPGLLVQLRIPDDVALARVSERERRRGTQVDVEAHRRHVEEFEAPSASEGPLLQVDASQPIAALAREIAEALPQRG